MKPRKHAVGIFVLPLLLLLFTAAGATAAPSVEEIVRKTNHAAYYQGDDGRAQVHMTITDSQGRKRNRRFTILRRDEPGPDGNQKFYVYFHEPADIHKMAFLVWKYTDRDDDRWLYLPALDLVKRIAASDKRTSFVGSDFFYEDVSGRGITEDHHTLKKETQTYYLLENKPKNPDSVEFSSFDMWIHKKTFLPVKIEYYDKNGEKYREYEVLEVKTIQGKVTPVKARMKDLKSGSETVVEYTDVKYDIGIPEEIFSERYLRRPPRKYLR